MLRTNEPALRFYRRRHARGLDKIEIMRLDGRPLHDLAAATHPLDGLDRPGAAYRSARAADRRSVS